MRRKALTKKYIDRIMERQKHIDVLNQKLLDNIKANMPELKSLYEQISGHWFAEDMVYRFYHQSYKAFGIQSETIKIVEALKNLAPDKHEFNEDFLIIFKEGTGKKFKMSCNRDWLKHTRPMVEAFFHAKMLLEMAIKYGKKLKKAPQCLPSGWALLLYFYNLR